MIAVFHLCQGLRKNLINSGNGSIVNVSSIYGMYSPDWEIYKGTKLGNSSAYASAKGGIIQLTKWLSTAFAPRVRVNCISREVLLGNNINHLLKPIQKKLS